MILEANPGYREEYVQGKRIPQIGRVEVAIMPWQYLHLDAGQQQSAK